MSGCWSELRSTKIGSRVADVASDGRGAAVRAPPRSEGLAGDPDSCDRDLLVRALEQHLRFALFEHPAYAGR